MQTCDVIDNQPLWLSLRGMVGCNLYRDGIWPIISNDGHLSYVRFKKDVGLLSFQCHTVLVVEYRHMLFVVAHRTVSASGTSKMWI